MKRDAPTLDRLSSINPDGSHKKIHVADVAGRWIRRRRALAIVLIAFYAVLPFVDVNGRPAVHLDIARRHFFLFGATFNAQDTWRVALLLLTAVASLLFVTAWKGRAWCGWACPQTVFLDHVFRPIERLLEGPREQRLRLDAAPWSVSKVARAALKHGIYLTIAFGLAHVALALFVSVPQLWAMIRQGPSAHGEAFAWTMGATAIAYFNFAWFREQFCVVLCPYGRLQSVLLDRDSTVIGYDRPRGEPRGKRTKESLALPVVQAPAAPAPAHGDCVDCNRCVHVCPTGIDIRNGLQLECIACAQCIDACDDVMKRLDRPEGLIRYDSLNGFATGVRKAVRPRLVFYGLVLVAASSGLAASLFFRTNFEANVIRIMGPPWTRSEGKVRNQFEVHLVNKNTVSSTLSIVIRKDFEADVVIPANTVTIDSLADYHVPVVISASEATVHGRHPLEFVIHDTASGEDRTVRAEFLSPGVAP